MKQNINLKNFKFIKNLDESKREATILLYKPIGTYYEEDGELVEGINGHQFAQELLWLQDYVDTIHVRINSIGGLIIDGWSIISAIINNKAEIITYNDGLAASIAGLIFAAGDKRMAMDYSILMIHNPSGGSEEVLDKFRESLLTILQNNSILDKDELDKLMDKETYLTCFEAKEYGFVDEVIETKSTIKIGSKNKAEIFNVFNSLIEKESMKKTKNQIEEVVSEVIADASLNIESIVSEDSNVSTDVENIAVTLETAPDEKATFINSINVSLNTEFEKDEDILNHISNALSELSETKEKHNALQKELSDVKDQLNKMIEESKEAKKAKIDEMVNVLFTSGKISKDEIANVKKLAEVDFETTKNCFEKIGNKKSVSIINSINNVAPAADSKNNWTLKDYWKKDPKELERIKNEMPSVYEQLVSDFNNKK